MPSLVGQGKKHVFPIKGFISCKEHLKDEQNGTVIYIFFYNYKNIFFSNQAIKVIKSLNLIVSLNGQLMVFILFCSF